MSAFAEAFASFGAQGIAVIPTRADIPSKPLVLRPDRFGVRASGKLLDRPAYANANAAFWTGKRAGLTIVDIDSADPDAEREARKRFGDTPVSAKTPSGGTHLYYRHGGEGRRIRPFGDSLPLDVLGNGIAVCPPSMRAATAEKSAGAYSFAEGSPDDFQTLPLIRSGAIPSRDRAPIPANCNPEEMQEGGGRNSVLFRIARSVAQGAETLEEIESALADANGQFATPLPLAELKASARSAWKYKLGGTLIVPGSKTAAVSLTELGRCTYAPALSLLVYLRCQHGPSHAFAIVPDSIAQPLGMNKGTIRKARAYLIETGFLRQLRQGGIIGGNQIANLYRFGGSI